MTGAIINLLLFAGKLFAGTVCGSVAIAADALNNLTDAGTVLLSAIGMKIASNGPGRNHPDGHGKLEWIISLVTGILIVQTGIEVGKNALGAILQPADTAFSLISVAILTGSICVKAALGVWYDRRAKRENSVSCRSISLDSFCDAASTAAALTALFLNHAFGWRVDGWFGAAMAIWILSSGMQIVIECAGRLMGKAAPEQAISEMRRTVQTVCPQDTRLYEPQIEDCGYGRYKASLCIAAAADETCAELVERVPAICAALKEKLGYDAVIQVEETLDAERERQMYAAVSRALDRTGVACRIGEFRVDRMPGGRQQIRMVLSVADCASKTQETLNAALDHPAVLGLPENVTVLAKIRTDRTREKFRALTAERPAVF
jgi:cation diffusion facilitator family transporter